MTSTIEYMALAAVAVVLIISLVQAAQLSGLNEKVLQQNMTLASLTSGGTNTVLAQATGVSQGSTDGQNVSPSQEMVGGC